MHRHRKPRLLAARMLAIGLTLVVASLAAHSAAEPAACLSFDPADWPAPARPYFMLLVDTSGSMIGCTNPSGGAYQFPNSCPSSSANNSCGMEPTRINDSKCALWQTVLAFAGEVNFGLATFAVRLSGCGGGSCVDSCTQNNGDCWPGLPSGVGTSGEYYPGNGCTVSPFTDWRNYQSCGNEPDCNGNPVPPIMPQNWENGGNVVVDMLQDPTWGPPPPTSNVSELLQWFDGDCSNSRELFAIGGTPIYGALRSVHEYFANGWSSLWNDNNYCAVGGPVIDHPTPLDFNQDPPCRSVNVILVTDGGQSAGCGGTPANAAADLYNIGVTIQGQQVPVRTYVIGFAGVPANLVDPIAAAGGTGSALSANNEVQLAQALANIVAGAMAPETCDNGDNNCNGCTDEGFKHYCNVNQSCCSWSTPAQRDACIANYEASVISSPPDGDLTLLPCITQSQQTDPATWLCYDPGDICDEGDNNCADGVDEGQYKCGNPPHCPFAEICNGEDDDCNGQIDDGGVCGSCTPSPEICDGCDNDCDGVADNGTFPSLPCGLPSPLNCTGTVACEPPQNVPTGTCTSGGGYVTCNNNPQAEVCDGVDNDCDSQIDEGYVSIQCEPTANPPGLVYGGTSQCTYGNTQCQSGSVVCVGGSGPSPEICDGIDNDCNGVVDDNPSGENQPCGINQPPCSPGTTQCVGGVMTCTGGVGPNPEVCDGIDNDCDGAVDESPLADAPTSPGCWDLPGNCCSHQNLSWCPPQGATCDGNGSLSAPCNKGTLSCDGANGWICVGPKGPSPEVCDGIDNDCNNAVDDGNLQGENQPCGTNTGECQQGTTQCSGGVLDCVGDIPPTPEVCDGLDNDCDGTNDNGVPAQGPCDPVYDTNLYPSTNPSLPPCAQGQLECDGNGGWVCTGGVGPSAELCDGIDNDCDGQTDETGAQPDGIDGSANPVPPPAANIGDACGITQGACAGGVYTCLNGFFICQGGVGPIPESCDCEDNDCDGSVDELPGPNEPPLCSPGKDCVKSTDQCQCAEPCGQGEYPCPPGQKCAVVDVSGGGQGQYCIVDYDAACGDCSIKTIKDGNDQTVCAPDGTDPIGCDNTPVCVCKGQSGCQEPCFNVTCTGGQVCSNFGPTPGQCVDNTCYQTGCAGCGKGCHGGLCADNPCQPGSCADNQTAKPSADWSTCDCSTSCADVSCQSGQKCVGGECVAWCDPLCPDGKVCDPATQTCVDSKCTPDSCPNGEACDPLTGTCGDEPCAGVLCPTGQICEDGDCVSGGGGGGGGGGGTSSGSGGGASSTSTSSGQGATGGSGVFGMPTGGGGCSCDLGAKRRPSPIAWLGLLGLGLLLRRRRRSGLERLPARKPAAAVRAS